MKIKEIVRRGIWMYGDTRAFVNIVRQNYVDWPTLADEEPFAQPVDADGCFYHFEWTLPGAGRGTLGPAFASVEAAMEDAERTVRQAIRWEPISI